MAEDDVMEGITGRSDYINRALQEMGLDQAAAALSEGHCPLCHSRHWTGGNIVDTEDDETRIPSSVVDCVECLIHWRSGPNRMNNMDWVEYSQTVRDGMIFTMTINAPPDPDYDTDEFWVDYDD